jgi:hypothetical protein
VRQRRGPGKIGGVQTLGSRQVYTNAWMSVREDDVRRVDGSPEIYGVVDKPDYALIITAFDEMVRHGELCDAQSLAAYAVLLLHERL